MADILEPLHSRERRRADLDETLKALTEKRNALESAIAEHENFDLQGSKVELDRLNTLIDQSSLRRCHAEMKLQEHSAALTHLKSTTVGMTRIFDYLSKDQIRLRSEARKLSGTIAALQDCIANEATTRQLYVQHADELNQRIRTFDFSNVYKIRGELSIEIKKIEDVGRIINLVDTDIKNIKANVGSYILEYKAVLRRVAASKAKIQALDTFSREIASARGGAERAQIHSKCEKRFGEGKPWKVRKAVWNELKSSENRRFKIERQIVDEFRRLGM
jgi:hypothetical protein